MDNNQISVEVYNKNNQKKMEPKQFLSMVEKAGSLTGEELSKMVSDIPNFTEVVKTTYAGVKYTFDEAIRHNDKVVNRVVDACHKKMDALDKIVDREDLTAEEKLQVVNEMSDVIKTLEKVDQKNKKFIEDTKIESNSIIVGTLGITATVVLTVIAMLGGRKK